jgi:hypothetical protein
LSYGDLSSEQSINIENDPRINFDLTKEKEIYNASKILESYLESAAKATKQLAQSKQIANEFLESLKDKDEEGLKQEIEQTEKIAKKIDDLFELFFGKEDDRQGITSDPNVSALERLGTASYYVSTRQNGLTDTEHTLMKNTKSTLQDALDKVNTFFEKDWKAYESSVKSIDLSPFKVIEIISLEN